MSGKDFSLRWVGGLLLLLLPLATIGQAATLWTGPYTNFTHLSFSDPNQAANQDRLTSNVWITRGSTHGLYNAATESSFTAFFSPAGTEWANGTLENYASLSYTNWNQWANGVNPGPPSTVGVNAVLHLITDDIYLAIQFTSWGVGLTGGGFSYMRTTPTIVPEPSTGLLFLLGAGFIWRRGRVWTRGR